MLLCLMRLRQAFAKERDAIRSRGGMVRMSDALRLGISRKALYPRGRNSGAGPISSCDTTTRSGL